MTMFLKKYVFVSEKQRFLSFQKMYIAIILIAIKLIKYNQIINKIIHFIKCNFPF